MPNVTYKSFNANNYILFKLTPKGEVVLQASRYSHIKPNEEGYYRLQMWQFMEIFGGENIDPAYDSLFNMNIMIAEKDLHNV